MSTELPPLPAPEQVWMTQGMGAMHAYSERQMRAYAEQVRAEERERIARHFDERDNGAGGFYEPHEPAEIIRALTPASPPTHPATD